MRLKILALLLPCLLMNLVLADSKSDAKKSVKHTVSIHDMKFDPASVDANVGDTVVWTNNDDRDHTVLAKDNSFKSDNLSSGDTFKFVFKKTGKFSYGCSLHPRMKGTINVSG